MNRYPLSWPQGWRRTSPKQRKNGHFGKKVRQYSSTPGGGSWSRHEELTVYEAVGRVLHELDRFGVMQDDAIISTNLPTRLDGLPRSDARKPQDPGVAVYWTRLGDPVKRPKVMAIDAYSDVVDNLAAIAATLEAMRAIERHGGALILDRAFEGFTALPAPGQTSRSWRTVLGIEEDSFISLPAVERIYFTLRSKYHPDKPEGDANLFNAVQKAWAQAQEELS